MRKTERKGEGEGLKSGNDTFIGGSGWCEIVRGRLRQTLSFTL